MYLPMTHWWGIEFITMHLYCMSNQVQYEYKTVYYTHKVKYRHVYIGLIRLYVMYQCTCIYLTKFNVYTV